MLHNLFVWAFGSNTITRPIGTLLEIFYLPEILLVLMVASDRAVASVR